MSVQRQGNWLGQQRVDVPHIRAMESSIAADFDVLGGLMLGGGAPQIVKGFNLLTTGAIGAPASNLQLVVAGGLVLHYGATESGSIFWVPSARANETLNLTNTNLSGSFIPSAVNYLGIDLIRSSDSSTSDNVQFLDANSLVEISRTVPLGRTLNYKIIISVTPFSANSNICPIAKVTTDANNNVTTIVDARKMLFRLATGGDVPNVAFGYPWNQGRNETTAADTFSGGDKAIGSFSEWSKSVMTRLWEIGGGEYWYSPAADRNVRLLGEGAVLPQGDYFFWDGTNLTWQNLIAVFGNSTGYYNEMKDQTVALPGLTDLQPGECLYADLDRTQNRTRAGLNALQLVKAPLGQLGTPAIPGARYVLITRTAAGNLVIRDRTFIVGQTIAATTATMGSVLLSATPSIAGTPVVATVLTGGAADVTGLVRDATNVNGVGALTYTASSIATAGSHIFDNTTTLTTGFISSFRNNTVEKAKIDSSGNVLTPGVDALAAGVLNVGVSTATSVSIAKAGVATTVAGSLTVTQAATLSSTLHVVGAATLDSTLNVTGTTTAATVNATGYQLSGTTVTVFPACWGSLSLTHGGGASVGSLYSINPAGTYVDLGAFFTGGSSSAGGGSTADASTGIITVAAAGTYRVSFSVSMGIPSSAAITQALTMTAKVVQSSGSSSLEINTTAPPPAGSASSMYSAISGQAITTVTASTTFKIQITCGVSSPTTNNLLIAFASLAVERIA